MKTELILVIIFPKINSPFFSQSRSHNITDLLNDIVVLQTVLVSCSYFCTPSLSSLPLSPSLPPSPPLSPSLPLDAQTMITHRPMLSLAALLSLLGVTFFYLIVLCQKKGERRIIPNNSRTLAKKAALRKKKQEEAKKAAKKSKDGTSLRSRQGRRDDTGIDTEELSQSDISCRTGTGSETGTQSEAAKPRVELIAKSSSKYLIFWQQSLLTCKHTNDPQSPPTIPQFRVENYVAMVTTILTINRSTT